MRFHALSPLLICTLVVMQVIGPATLWAAEERSIRIDESRRMVIAAVDGTQLAVRNGSGTKPVQFRDVVNAGEYLMTGDHTMADLLIGNRAVITMGNDTALQLLAVSPEQTTIQVTKGMVRVAAAASVLGPQGVVTVQTPTGQVQTRGGIVRVWIETQMGKAESVPMGKARPYKAAYAPDRLMVASETPQSELIQVEEGAAEILGAGGKTVTIQTGQSVTLQGGGTGDIGGLVTQNNARPGVVATAGHSQTPKEGRDYLVALQVDQATQLGRRLTDPAETGSGESEKKSDTKNVINGATGGVTLTSNASLVSTLFGDGRAANPASGIPQDRLGSGFGGNNNNGLRVSFACDNPANCNANIKGNGGNTLLVFTRKDPVVPFVEGTTNLPEAEVVLDANRDDLIKYSLTNPTEPPEPLPTSPWLKDEVCSELCLASHYHDAQKDSNNPRADVTFDPSKPLPTNVGFRPLNSILSKFTVAKELVLVGGGENAAHGGVAPTERLIIRGASPPAANDPTIDPPIVFTNLAPTQDDPVDGIFPSDRDPVDLGNFAPAPRQVVAANSTFVVENPPKFISQRKAFFGGTLGQYSNDSTSSPNALVADENANSQVDGAITATGVNVVLKGGVTLDQETTATIGTTPATNAYFTALPNTLGRKFGGSLLSVIRGPNNTPTALTIQDRMLGVYDGSEVKTEGGNKALLSILNAKLKGPGSSIPLIDIAAGKHFDRDGNATPGKEPSVTVTSAIVTRSTLPLDGALLEASAPLFALTKATMTTTNHFADLAGNQAQSLNLNGALVALNASKLVINSGHLLNLNNATVAISGYLFSLTNGSQLDIKNGALFSLSNGSSLALNGNGFGVFGSGSNTVTIENNLCTGACGTLVNSANQPITTLDGIPLKVSGVTQDVVLPNGFNAFALAPGTTASNAKIDIDANDALFHIDPTSTLTINGTKVK